MVVWVKRVKPPKAEAERKTGQMAQKNNIGLNFLRQNSAHCVYKGGNSNATSLHKLENSLQSEAY